ncbi:MAG: hypothetical protein EBT79_04710 [Actinobacteria bacterium]|nr:hypothetical protein [Actinomycetota bacterium]NBR66574.1 hypothetical protein [Actinomycetota bacterium]
MQEDDLNPIQFEVLSTLRVPEDWRPLDPGVVAAVESLLVETLAPLRGRFTAENPLRINKNGLSTVHGCEKFHVEQKRQPFAWNVNTVRGTIVHKAVELLLNWRGPVTPADVVDEAIASIADNPRESASDFLDQLPAAQMAELRGAVMSAVTNFVDCFPPLKRQWRPLVEYSVLYDLFDKSVQFNTRMDLVIGQPGRRVLIDLKTGRVTPTHRDDLRYYALIETLRTRQAPRLLASYSLDSARLDEEEVSEGVLQAAVRRTAAGAIAIAELQLKSREPRVRPGMQCRWCPVAGECAEGQRHLREMAGGDDDEA